jgi:hypothetical protein
MNAYKNRLGLMIAMATCIVALAVPAAGQAASIARCDVRAHTPFHLRSEGPKIFYGAQVGCNGSVTLDKVVVKLQKQRFGGSWRVIDKLREDRVEVRHRHQLRYFKGCNRRLVGTFRAKAVITKGSNSETDVSDQVRLHCGSS